METPSYIAMSRQMTLRSEMDIIAHNLANMNTTGYKQQRLEFNEYLVRPAIREQFSMVIDRAARRDTAQGPLEQTGNPLDLAIVGNGYFTVDTVHGPRYTRAGQFTLNEQGDITTTDGLPVLDTGGQPITIPRDAGEIVVKGDGSITTAANPAAPIGRLDLVTFDAEQELLEVGSGLYAPNEQEPQPAPPETSVKQGVVEQSNVQPILEMTRMIETSRAYQSTQRMMDREHERIRSAIQRLGQTV